MLRDIPGRHSEDVLKYDGRGTNLFDAELHHGDVPPVWSQATQGAYISTLSEAQFSVPRDKVSRIPRKAELDSVICLKDFRGLLAVRN